MLRILRAVASVCLAIAAPLAAALAQGNPSGAAGEQRTVVATVITSKGQLVNGLEPGNFRAELDGHPVQIISATYDTAPHRVVLLLDWSGSMWDKRIIETTIAGNLLARINLASPVAVRTFSSKIQDESPLSTDRASAHAKLQNLAYTTSGDAMPHGNTPLVDALDNTRAFLSPAQPGDAICVITDCGENSSKKGEWKERKILGGSGIRIFSILFTEPHGPMLAGRSPEGAEGPDLFSSVSENSGGRFQAYEMGEWDWLSTKWAKMDPEKTKRQRAVLLLPIELMALEINFCYRLEIQLPEKIEKPRKFKLEVVDLASGKVDRSLTVHYPTRLYPVAVAQ